MRDICQVLVKNPNTTQHCLIKISRSLFWVQPIHSASSLLRCVARCMQALHKIYQQPLSKLPCNPLKRVRPASCKLMTLQLPSRALLGCRVARCLHLRSDRRWPRLNRASRESHIHNASHSYHTLFVDRGGHEELLETLHETFSIIKGVQGSWFEGCRDWAQHRVLLRRSCRVRRYLERCGRFAVVYV